MCCSRKYPYPSHGRLFGLNPPTPLEFPVKPHMFLLKIWLLRPPTPLEFPLTFHGVGMDIFWNCTIIKGQQNCIRKANAITSMPTLMDYLGLPQIQPGSPVQVTSSHGCEESASFHTYFSRFWVIFRDFFKILEHFLWLNRVRSCSFLTPFWESRRVTLTQ